MICSGHLESDPGVSLGFALGKSPGPNSVCRLPEQKRRQKVFQRGVATPTIKILGGCVAQSVRAPRYANYLTGTLCIVWKTNTNVCFASAYIGEKNEINQIKKQADMLLPLSPQVVLGNNYPILNVYDVVPRV